MCDYSGHILPLDLRARMVEHDTWEMLCPRPTCVLRLRQARGELANESDAVKNLVCKLTGEEMRSNMTEIGVAMYRIGKIESTTLSQDECTARARRQN